MKPIEFEGQNVVYAKGQRPYLPLPAYASGGELGMVTACWKLTWRERLQVLRHGLVWSQAMTFNKPLQPQRLSTLSPF